MTISEESEEEDPNYEAPVRNRQPPTNTKASWGRLRKPVNHGLRPGEIDDSGEVLGPNGEPDGESLGEVDSTDDEWHEEITISDEEILDPSERPEVQPLNLQDVIERDAAESGAEPRT